MDANEKDVMLERIDAEIDLLNKKMKNRAYWKVCGLEGTLFVA